MKLVVSSLFVLALPFAIAHADRRPGPPPGAFEACAKSKAGDVCSVTMHDRTINGVCTTAPDSAGLFCRPDHPPGPPPEAVEACNGRAAGDACSVTRGDRTLTGTCAAGPDGAGQLACRPSGPPPRR